MRYFLIFVPLFFCACGYFKQQSAIDHALEDVGLDVAKAGARDYTEVVKERESQEPKKP